MIGYIVQQTETGMYLRKTGAHGLILSKDAPRFYAKASSAKRAITNYKYHKDYTDFVIKKVKMEVLDEC